MVPTAWMPGQARHDNGTLEISVSLSHAEKDALILMQQDQITALPDMDVSHLVKVSTFLVNADDLKDLGPVRSGFLGAMRPASTLLVVAALAKPEWLVEIEALACRP